MSSSVDRVAAVKVFESANREENITRSSNINLCTYLQTPAPPSSLDMQLGSTRHRKQEALRQALDLLHRRQGCTGQGMLASWNGRYTTP